MKKILFVLLAAPFFANAQECKINRETDPFTKQIKLSTGFIFFDGGSATIDADAKEISILFSIEGADKCFDNTSTGFVFFEGVKSKLSVRNSGTMNCEGLFQLVFKNSPAISVPSMLQKFMNQQVNHIIFTGNNKKESTVNLSASEQKTLAAMTTCLVNEAKTIAK